MRGKQTMSSQNGTATASVGETLAQRLRARIIETRHHLPEKAMRFPDWDLKNDDGEVVEQGWVFMRALTAAQRGVVYNSSAVPDPKPGQPNNQSVDRGKLMIWICIFAMYAAIPDPDDPSNPQKLRRDEKPLWTLADYQVVSELNGAIIQDASEWVMSVSGMRQKDLDDAKNGSSPAAEKTDSITS